MSTVLHRRESHIAITAEEAAVEFANAPCDIQAEFINWVIHTTENWVKSSPHGQTPFIGNQLLAIREEMQPHERKKAIALCQMAIEYFE